MSKYEQAISTATERGHDLEEDPPGGISRVRRATCTKCGRAILCNGNVVYGSATEGPCKPC